ncbi:MAG: rod shape-determining protein MreC, partial [Patescibacteria group bacterium]
YAPGDVLIGAISDVLPETSKVSLFSSSGNILYVLIGPSNAPATAVGRGGGQYTAQLPRAVKISAGDFVIVPSIDDKPFGIVSAVESDSAQSFEIILFASPVNIYQLRWVLVEHI